MATPEENIARFQEIANRGLQDQLDPEKLAIFNEALSRGLITSQAPQQPATGTGLFATSGQAPLFSAEEAIAEKIGGAETALSLASSIAAPIVGGLSGLASEAAQFVGILPEDAPSGGDVSQSVSEALTFQPTTAAGQAQVSGIGEALAPVGQALSSAEQFLGENTLEATGSPFLASVAHTLPTAALEALGFGAGGRFAKGATGLERAPKKLPTPTKVKTGEVSKALVEAAPEIQQIKDASRGVYKEIKDLGVTIQPGAYERFVKKIVKTAKDERVNRLSNPKAFGAMQEFQKELRNVKGKDLEDIDSLRRTAQDAASAIDPSDARIGMLMIDEIDQFLDSAKPETFRGVKKKQAANVSESYKAARNLWGRARRAELIQDAFSRAQLVRTGLENGMRQELTKIVNNKKRARFFTKDEISSMREVIQGTNEQNITKLVGKLGFSEGRSTQVLNGLASSAVLGPFVTAIGQVSKGVAQRATRKGFDFADAIIKSGSDGQKVVEAYLQVTPKSKRSIGELSDLLVDPKLDLKALLDSSDKVIKEAAEIARGRRAFNVSQTIGAAAPVALTQER